MSRVRVCVFRWRRREEERDGDRRSRGRVARWGRGVGAHTHVTLLFLLDASVEQPYTEACAEGFQESAMVLGLW